MTKLATEDQCSAAIPGVQVSLFSMSQFYVDSTVFHLDLTATIIS